MSTQKNIQDEAVQPKRTLSMSDVEQLLSDNSSHQQMELVIKLSDLYATEGNGALSEKEAGIANEIFHILMTKADVLVRSTLALSLSQTDKLPPDLAKQMASDVSEVASPVLQYSDVLNDSDLSDIIHSFVDSNKLSAIAKRDTVSRGISEMLADTSIDAVVSELVRNEGADIAPATFEKIAERHSNSPEVMESVLQRSSVPVTVVDKIIQHVSSSMRQQLEQRYGNLETMRELNKALDESVELSALKMIGLQSSDRDLNKLLSQMDGKNRTMPFIALGLANPQLFELSLARLLKLPLQNVHVLMKDPVGFRKAYDQAQLPELLFDATALALRAIREVEQESAKKNGRKLPCTPEQMKDRMKKIVGRKKMAGLEELYKLMETSVA
ncbi:MAG TPA: DUF2336 domain-containing protein [Rickettsiales bacterium]|nr:DUF2336 domain-containing protein [Rickettsiales bacterium]